ncbi:hypothetical protein [Halomonas sp.]|uniref:hypothetical protein n=1 Tax=Halomonas sp. TaxID=1486246 RepID=UPI003562591B
MGKDTVNLGVEFDADDYDEGALDALDTVEVAAGKKIQLEQFEPIDDNVSLSADLSGLDIETKVAVINELGEMARDACEANIARRYEQHVRKEAFGE